VRVTRNLATVLLAAVALVACGGGDDDEQDAEQTVKDFVQATNDRDADKFCDELVTQEFLEGTTGATGDNARDACKRQLRSLKGLQVKLDEVKETKVDGDRATVTATIEAQGRKQDRDFKLVNEDGDWRLAGGSGE
jgi:predicted lipid-binding transport protein (Tim44 family)